MRRLVQSLAPVDALTIAYNAFVVLLVCVRHDRLPCWHVYFLCHLTLFCGIALCIRFRPAPDQRLLGFVRYGYPILLYFFFHYESGIFNQLIFEGYFDDFVRSVDRRLFGRSLHSELAKLCDVVWVHEFFHLGYATLYPLIVLPGVFICRKSRATFIEFVFVMTLAMCTCYAIFICFPVVGPTADRAQLFDRGVLFIPMMDWVFRFGDTPGGAVPSSHVATAIIAWLYCRRIFPKSSVCLGGVVIWLGVATVYCSYHYCIDALLGVVAGFGFYMLGRRLYRRMAGLTSQAASRTSSRRGSVSSQSGRTRKALCHRPGRAGGRR